VPSPLGEFSQRQIGVPLTHGERGKPLEPCYKGRATADEYSGWGVAAGILSIEGCGEAGNPCIEPALNATTKQQRVERFSVS
jgi:hypothetical protein